MATIVEPGTPRAWAVDEALGRLLDAERGRQRDCLNLLAGENVMAPAVHQLLGSAFAEKYAEGYPGRRHHTGCGPADAVEELAARRAEALFGAEHANVQPYSGSVALLAAAAALLKPGDSVLAMSVAHGGHLTSGSAANFSGRWFDVAGYGVRRADGRIDLDQVRDLARAHRPKVLLAGAIAYPRAIDWAAFREIADEVGAFLVADAAQTLGLSAAGLIASPVPHADVVVGVSHKLLGGPRGGFLLCTRELAERIDRAVFPFVQGGPMVNQLAAKAYIFGQADRPAFGDYAAQCVANAKVLAEGLAAEGFRPLTGGTDTHLVTVDAEATGLTGRELELRAEEAGLLLGRCAVPFAPTPPSEVAGLRMGTAWSTSQGLREPELEHVARLIGRIARGDRGAAGEIRELAQSTKPQCGESASF